MSEELIIQHCSPTLAGLKTGSLFTCPCPSEEEARQLQEEQTHFDDILKIFERS